MTLSESRACVVLPLPGGASDKASAPSVAKMTVMLKKKKEEEEEEEEKKKKKKTKAKTKTKKKKKIRRQ